MKPENINKLTATFDAISMGLKLPFIIHKSGRGKPGRGSCWIIKSFYPLQDGSGEYLFAAAPTLEKTAAKFKALACKRRKRVRQ